MLKQQEQEQIMDNHTFNIIDLLLLDHQYLKECIKVLKSEESNAREKMKYARGFLDALKKHSEGEKKSLYAPLEEHDEFRHMILEAEVEHGIVDKKVKYLHSKIAHKQTLDDVLAAELKVLAEVVEHHLEEEEDELFVRMKKELSSELLNQMGFQFMTIRQFEAKDLKEEPELKKTIPFVKKHRPTPSATFLKQTHKYLHAQ